MLWTVDLALPALFALTLLGAFRRGRLRRFAWLGPLAAAVDYLENVAITGLIVGYPGQADALAWLASALTATKLTLYLAALVAAAAGAWLERRARPSPVGGTGARA